jgi:hypothetical protein
LSKKDLEGLTDQPPPAEQADDEPSVRQQPEPKPEPEPERRERRTTLLELPESPTPRQLNEIVDELLPGLLGRNRDPDERPPRDVLERLLPELPLLGR